jgi:hypothetical protein
MTFAPSVIRTAYGQTGPIARSWPLPGVGVIGATFLPGFHDEQSIEGNPSTHDDSSHQTG